MWIYLGLAVLALLFYLLKSFKHDQWDKKGVPTASGCEWFFGHYKPILLVKKHMNMFYNAMYKEFPDAPLVGFYAMNSPGLLVRDLDIIKTVLLTEFSSFNFNGFSIDRQADVLAGANPFFLSGDDWKAARANVTPALSLAKLKGYLPSILGVGDELVKYVRKSIAVGTAELEGRELAEKFTTDVIGNAIFGIKNNTFEDKNSLFAQLTQEIIFKFTLMENIKFFLQQIPIVRRLFPTRFTSPKLQNLLVSLTSKIIEERKRSGEKRNDVFQSLMAMKENDTQGIFTVEYMSGQLFTIIADMYDTSSNAIALILYTLSMHPEVQERLRSEIMEMKQKNEITVEDIENAKYLTMVFGESFRMYSFISSKECTQDCYLPMPGSEPFKVTKGTTMIIPVTGIHNDPKYYPDPDKFDPERFTEEEIARRPRFTYMPFGEGPRKCLGMRIANLLMKVAIMKILENFRVKPSPKTKYPIEFDPAGIITLRPKDGAWVIFEEIK